MISAPVTILAPRGGPKVEPALVLLHKIPAAPLLRDLIPSNSNPGLSHQCR